MFGGKSRLETKLEEYPITLEGLSINLHMNAVGSLDGPNHTYVLFVQL